MRNAAAGFVALVLLAGCGANASTDPAVPEGLFDSHRAAPLRRFASAGAFERYVAERRRALETVVMNETAVFDVQEAPPPQEAPSAPGIEAPPAMAQQASVAEPGNPAITNNQTIGVDEGGIVKQVGRFLVVLQDGRLFSADLGAGEGAPLRLADRMDVYRDVGRAASWYDEMLVHGDRILVTAYNYSEQASEITVARIDAAGKLTREGRFLISSNDYYSTENYSTRLVGDSLVFYAPVALASYGDEGAFRFPQLRRARGDGEPDRGEALLRATDIYAPPGEVADATLHAVSICPLRGGDLDCRTSAFVGGASREIYVSPTDAFLWVSAPDDLPWEIEYANKRRTLCRGRYDDYGADHGAAMLYRVPLDGSGVRAVGVDGYPVDQFAFDSRGGRFRALLRRQGENCDAGTGNALALIDLPLAAFGENVRHVAGSAYRPLPGIEGEQLENRFLGDWLLYGGRSGYYGDPSEPGARAGSSTLFAVPLAVPPGAPAAAPVRLTLPHDVLRIERAGSDAVVTGYGSPRGLSLSYIGLGAAPRIAGTGLLPGRVESEGRSHAFNAWLRGDGSGLIGLPTSRSEGRAGRGWSDSESSDLSYIAIAPDKRMTPAGQLSPAPPREGRTGYRCQVSCVDWYGNSRPIFTGGRIFALMGTDLVEGRMDRGRVVEAGRVDLTAPVRVASR
ncbi:MAG TPA: beta-propeller domain-containing protein [Allosphingosinicella sp.]|nr:beta-propeller domain-containing protein [Allosphingosinicella sp.]